MTRDFGWKKAVRGASSGASTWARVLVLIALLAGFSVRVEAQGTQEGAQEGAPITPPVSLSLRASSGVLREGGRVTIDVFLSAPLSEPSTILFALRPAPDDFGTGGTLPFARLSASPLGTVLGAGQTHASFVLSAPEDDLRYTSSRFYIHAQHSSTGAPASRGIWLAFEDNDPARLELRPNGNIWREDTTETEPLLSVATNVRSVAAKSIPTFTLRSSRPHVVYVRTPTNRLPNSPSSPFPLYVSFDRAKFTAPVPVTLTAGGPGLPTATATVVVVDSEAGGLGLSVAPSAVDEDSRAPAIGTVTRVGDLSRPLQVLLGSSDPRQVRLPASVTMAPGSKSARFEAWPIESRQASEHDIHAVIWASAKPLALIEPTASARATLRVRDATPFINARATPAQFFEQDAPVQGALTLSLARARHRDVPVTLRSTDPRILLASRTAILPRGGGVVRVPFTVRAHSKPLPQFASIEVVDGYTRLFSGREEVAASASLRLFEADAPLSLSLSRDTILFEASADIAVTITRRQARAQPLQVQLSAALSFPTGMAAPALPPSVFIPAGARSITIPLRVLASAVLAPDGNSARIEFQARAGEAHAEASLSVLGPSYVFSSQETWVVLSASAPDGIVILSIPNFRHFVSPLTLLIRSNSRLGRVAAPASVRMAPHQEFVAIPVRLLIPPEGQFSGGEGLTVSIQGAPSSRPTQLIVGVSPEQLTLAR